MHRDEPNVGDPTGASLRLAAPAKLNLFLHVVGRLPDGYHELQTFFVFVDLCDTVCLRLRRDGRILRTRAVQGVSEADDLSLRAALRLQQRSGTALGVEIEVDKRIPMGGGLGGGSSDAASVLLGLNRLWSLGWSGSKLAALGLELGADVPVFVHGEAGFAQGVGEQITPLEVDCPWYVLIVPDCHVSTAEVFADPQLTRDAERLTIRDFLAGGAFAPQGKLRTRHLIAGTRNDCEPVARRRHPALAHAWDVANSTLREVRSSRCADSDAIGELRLTGTGACCFVSCQTHEHAMALSRSLAGRLQCHVTRGLQRSPATAS